MAYDEQEEESSRNQKQLHLSYSEGKQQHNG